jgi:acetylornithine deacetylase
VKIAGGAEQATTPISCHGVWAVVVSPNRRFAEVRDEIARVLETESGTSTWLRQNPAQLTAPYLQGYFEPVNTPTDHAACTAMLDAVESATGQPTNFQCMPTPSDANFFAENGKPVIVCGPGNLFGNGVHGLNEHIEINSLIDAAKTYAAFLINYCSTARQG